MEKQVKSVCIDFVDLYSYVLGSKLPLLTHCICNKGLTHQPNRGHRGVMGTRISYFSGGVMGIPQYKELIHPGITWDSQKSFAVLSSLFLLASRDDGDNVYNACTCMCNIYVFKMH